MTSRGPSSTLLRRLRSGVGLRLVGVATVFILALGAFAGGAHTSGVPEMSSEPFVAWLYFAAGLFVFGGLDLGSPEGAPVIARTALWIAYFLAPAITTTTVIEAMLRVIRPDWMQRRGLRDHVILAGAGRVGLAYLAAIRAVEPDRLVLLVDHVGDQVRSDEAIRTGNVKVLRADIRRPATFETLAIERADRMVIVTDNDLANLEAAWTAQIARPGLPVAVHVGDLTLLRPVNRLIRGSSRGAESGGAAPLVFNTHRISALHLYERHLHPHFQETGYRDVVVIGGFGRFAQTIVELLRATAADDLERIVIVDKEAAGRVRKFAADVSLDELTYSTVDGELEDPGTWAEVEQILGESGATPVYLLAAEEEVVNFRAAMLLRGRSGEPRVFARCFHRTAFAESLAEQLEFELLAFEDVLRDALREHYESLLTV